MYFACACTSFGSAEETRPKTSEHQRLPKSDKFLPFLRTNPSTTGVMLDIECPTSTTRAEPFPAANLTGGFNIETGWKVNALRIQHTCVRDIKGGDLEFFKHNLGHSFPISRRVPCGLGDKNWVLGWISAHHVHQCVRYQGGDWVEVGY